MTQDLRRWLAQASEAGELVTCRGVDWRIEIGALTDLAGRQPDGPALLFDEIPGYSRGWRVLTNTLGTARRVARAANLAGGNSTLDLVAAWKRRYSEVKLVPPVRVQTGPVFEHTMNDGEVDLLRFPAPQWRSGDGGRYIGTAPLLVTRDPDSGSVNVAVARVMVHDSRHVFYRVSSGKDSRRHFAAAERAGTPMPIAISNFCAVFCGRSANFRNSTSFCPHVSP